MGVRSFALRLVFLCVSLALGIVAVAEPLTLPAYKVVKAPVIDGVINPEEWANVPTASGAYDSMTGEKGSEPMQVWLAYDDDCIYFAAKLSDRLPKTIHATQYQTNVSLTGDDYVELSLDLNGSLSNYSTFSINPRGATSVALAGGRALKREWAGEFVAAARVTNDGWEVEARISWQILPLPAPGKRDVRFEVDRFLPRDQRDYQLVYNSAGSVINTPVWKDVPIPTQKKERVLKLLPYGYAGYDNTVRGSTVLNSGLDLKTELTDNVSLVGTVNPDFRNVENQILNLDFSRFARLAGESRPFFLEGRDYLNTQLFSSQLIHEVDTGVNAYGRLNDKTTFGVIDTISFHRENDFVSNFTYTPTPTDSFRGTLTNFSKPGLENLAYLARYAKQLGGYNLFFRSMGSQDTQTGFGHDDSFSLQYFKKEWQWAGEYLYVTPNFNPRLGFFPEVDYKGPDGGFQYDKPWKHGVIAEITTGAAGSDYTRLDGSEYRQNFDLNGGLSLRNGLNATSDFFAEDFQGEHDHTYTFGVNYPRDNLFRNVSLNYQTGELALLPYQNITTTLAYRFNQRLQTNLSFQVVKHGSTQDQLILTGSYDLGKNQAIVGRLIQQTGSTGGFISYSRSNNKGIEYFLIVGDPNSMSFRASVILKVVVPIEIKLSRR